MNSLVLIEFFVCCSIFVITIQCNVLAFQERIPVDEVFRELNCTKEGLSNEEGQKRLQVFGPNKLEEKKAIIYLFTNYVYVTNSLHNII